MRKSGLIQVLAGLTAIILSVLLLSQIQLPDIYVVLSLIEPSYLAGGFVFYALAFFFRAMRLRVMFSGKIPFGELLNITCFHNLSNVIMPAHTGELSYVYLIKKRHSISVGQGITSLIILRTFDVLSIIIIFFTALPFVRQLPHLVSGTLWSIAILLAIIMAGVIGTVIFKHKFVSGTKRLFSLIARGKAGSSILVVRKGSEIMADLERVRLDKRILLVFLFSLAVWISLCCASYFIFRAFSIDLGLFEIFLISSLVSLVPLLPIYGFGGFGITEVTMAALLISFEVLKETAILASFGIHIVAIIYSFIFGLYGACMLKLRSAKAHNPRP